MKDDMRDSLGTEISAGTSERDEGGLDLAADSQFEMDDSAMEDVRGTPTWPIVPPESTSDPIPPPVGLSWSRVAEKLGIDIRILEHDGVIVLAGEYVPAFGFVIDPKTYRARAARVGDRVLSHSYFIGETTAGEFGLHLPLDPDSGSIPNVVVRSAGAPIIGLFSDERDAERARRHLLEGSLGYGISVQRGPLGTEVRVARSDVPGMVATVMTGHRGAVISVGGQEL